MVAIYFQGGRVRGLLEQANAQGEILLIAANESDCDVGRSGLPNHCTICGKTQTIVSN